MKYSKQQAGLKKFEIKKGDDSDLGIIYNINEYGEKGSKVLNAIAAEGNFVFVGTADVVLRFARSAWMKICGVCHAMLLHGSARIVADKTVLGINKIQRCFIKHGFMGKVQPFYVIQFPLENDINIDTIYPWQKLMKSWHGGGKTPKTSDLPIYAESVKNSLVNLAKVQEARQIGTKVSMGELLAKDRELSAQK